MSHKCRPTYRLADRPEPECGLLRGGAVGKHLLRSQRGFTILELLMVMAIIGVLAGVAIGVTPSIIESAKGASGAQQLDGFLKRTREAAISRRRNIRIQFMAPDRIQSALMPVPGVPGGPTVLETMPLEGGIGFRQFAEVTADTPDAFGDAAPVTIAGVAYDAFIAGPNVAMFTSEGVFADANGFPVNATVFLGKERRPETANALTIFGATAMLRTFRWDGSRWVR